MSPIDERKPPKGYTHWVRPIDRIDEFDYAKIYSDDLVQILSDAEAAGVIEIRCVSDHYEYPEHFLQGFRPFTEKELVKQKEERRKKRLERQKAKEEAEAAERAEYERLRTKYEHRTNPRI